MADPGSAASPFIDAQKLADQAIALSRLASHPGFLAILDEIRKAPEKERLKTAERLANIASLRERGVPIPDEFRLTTRYFEHPQSDVVGSVKIDSHTPAGSDDDEFASGITICGSVGYILCGSIGGQPVMEEV